MTVLIVKKFSSAEEVSKGCDIALKNRLYVSGWALSSHLKSLRKGRKQGELSIVFSEETPVAVALLSGKDIQVFCKKSERRKGYGTMAITALLENYSKEHLFINDGIEGSYRFFEKAIPSNITVAGW